MISKAFIHANLDYYGSETRSKFHTSENKYDRNKNGLRLEFADGFEAEWRSIWVFVGGVRRIWDSR